MVEDDRCCSDPGASCLRLRIGTRRVAPLHCEGLESKMPQLLTLPEFPDDVAYRHSATKMWPPSASKCSCSKMLHRILNPPLPEGPAYNCFITGILDERSLVYMIRPEKSYSPSDDNASGIIVMVNFSRSSLVPRNIEDGSQELVQNESEWHWVPGACRRGDCQ